MLKLRVIQAAFGDCLLLELGDADDPRYVLIDGGPDLTYDRHLKQELQSIGGKLDISILSHVDSDHVVGLLDLMADLKAAGPTLPKPATIGELWHNSFTQTVGAGNDIGPRLRATMASAGALSTGMAASGAVVQSIAEGDQLRRDATLLQVPINPGFTDRLIMVETAVNERAVGGARLRVVGPTQAILDQLKVQWLEWLDKHGPAVASGDPLLAAYSDRRIPNLSSITLLVSEADKSILLTGDARGDHILKGLATAGLLNAKGKIHVSVLKLPHHGSDANVTRTFFKTVTADTYVASADGTNKNPDLATLIWIVEAARQQRRTITIVATNETPSLLKLQADYSSATYGYTLEILPSGAHSLTIELIPG